MGLINWNNMCDSPRCTPTVSLIYVKISFFEFWLFNKHFLTDCKTMHIHSTPIHGVESTPSLTLSFPAWDNSTDWRTSTWDLSEVLIGASFSSVVVIPLMVFIYHLYHPLPPTYHVSGNSTVIILCMCYCTHLNGPPSLLATPYWIFSTTISIFLRLCHHYPHHPEYLMSHIITNIVIVLCIHHYQNHPVTPMLLL